MFLWNGFSFRGTYSISSHSLHLQLKPYVPYNIKKEVVQSEFTAKALFDATYGKKVAQLYGSRKINISDVKDVVDNYKDDESVTKS